MHTETRQCNGAADRTLSLRGALGYIARSALQLHRYRYIRTRMLHDSLDRIDSRARNS